MALCIGRVVGRSLRGSENKKKTAQANTIKSRSRLHLMQHVEWLRDNLKYHPPIFHLQIELTATFPKDCITISLQRCIAISRDSLEVGRYRLLSRQHFIKFLIVRHGLLLRRKQLRDRLDLVRDHKGRTQYLRHGKAYRAGRTTQCKDLEEVTASEVLEGSTGAIEAWQERTFREARRLLV